MMSIHNASELRDASAACDRLAKSLCSVSVMGEAMVSHRGSAVEPAYSDLDKPVIAVLAFLAGLVGSCFIYLLLQGIALDGADRIRAGGAAFGGFMGGISAAVIWYATERGKRRERENELDQMKRAIWQDLRATFQVMVVELRSWSHPTFLGTKNIVQYDVEHLRPTVFDAILDKIGRLTEEQSYHLLLVHDNLRSTREAMSKFAYCPEGLSSGELQRHRDAMKERVKEVVYVLKLACQDAKRAIEALDPHRTYERRYPSRHRLHDILGQLDDALAGTA